MITKEITKEGKLPLICITTPASKAVISLYGAHVLSWVPEGHEDVLFVSPLSRYKTGEPIRGGIPVCWPWFGKEKLPQHGVARTSLWTLEVAEERQDGTVRVVMSLMPDGFNGLSAKMEIIVGETLTQILTTTAGTEPVVVPQALHTYFNVNVQEATVEGLKDVEFSERAAVPVAQQEAPVLAFKGGLDRIYSGVEGEIGIVDPSLKQKIKLDRQGSESVVVWNPWRQGAKGMKDLPDNGWQFFLCVETANLDCYAPELGPGDSVSMGHIISVERL